MSSSNMCVLALCFVLFAVTQGRVIKSREFPLSAEGVTMELVVKNKSDRAHPISLFVIDVDQMREKVTVTQKQFSKGRRLSPRTRKMPTLENRFGVKVGTCPVGTVRHGRMCWPEGTDY